MCYFFTDSPLAQNSVPEKEVRNTLLTYLCRLTLTEEDAFGLRLPEKEMPEGFYLIHERWSKRTKYVNDSGFAIILSKEHTRNTVMEGEESRQSVFTLFIVFFFNQKGEEMMSLSHC